MARGVRVLNLAKRVGVATRGVYARNYHSYTHLLLALGIIREPKIWWLIKSKYLAVLLTGVAPARPSTLERVVWALAWGIPPDPAALCCKGVR